MSAVYAEPERLIRLPELKRLVGFAATSTIYRLMRAGEFPACVKIGSRAVADRHLARPSPPAQRRRDGRLSAQRRARQAVRGEAPR
jgi:predicted DNA-binding transcriptional regulator AlpA